MSWRNVQKFNRKHGTRFVCLVAHHNHGKIGITSDGSTVDVHPDGTMRPSDDRTSSARYLATGDRRGLDDWADELDRRRAALEEA